MVIGSYFFKNGEPAGWMAQHETTIDNTGTGWLSIDLSNYIKPKLEFQKGQWVVIETATPAEIDAWQIEKQRRKIEQMNTKFKSEGEAYYNELKTKITASLIGKANAVTIMSEIAKTIYPMLNKIKDGDWALAMLDYLDNKNMPTIQEVIDLFNEVGQYAVNYYQTQYPH
jgi:hypothetical protein